MHSRLLSACAFSVIVAVGGWVATPALEAQGQAPSATRKPKPVARTADGKPDLQGTYDVATITPLERPAEFGNRATLTAEEAKLLESLAEADRGETVSAKSLVRDLRDS